MKQKFLYRLRKDTDMIWKGGMGAVLILLLLCMGLMRQAVREEDFFVRTDQCMKLVAVYGVACLAVFAGAYYMIVRSVNGTLWQLGDMIESLTEGTGEGGVPCSRGYDSVKITESAYAAVRYFALL